MASNGNKSRKKIIIFSLAGVLLLAVVAFILLGSRKEPITPVQVEKVSRQTITQVVTATGKIQPEVSVKISPEVSGEITLLPVKEGQRVKKGDVILKIKPDVYIAQRDQYAAALLSAQANLTKTEPEYKRIKTLFEKGLVSQSEFDQARASFESAKASYAQARASLNQSEENLRKTTVVSPMDGTVSQLNSRLGERVLGTAQFQGTDVMTIADLSRMEGRVDVSETDVILVSIGDTARIAVDALPDRKVNGVVYEIANTGKSKGTGTQEEVTNFEVKMRIVDTGVTIRPGMSMTADVETETKQNILVVPIQSVTTRSPKGDQKGGGPEEGQAQPAVQQSNVPKTRAEKPREIVFVVEEGKVKAVTVKRGISNDSFVEIQEGVTEGQQVVSGSYKAINRELEDGAKVRVEEQKKNAGKPQGEGA
jgi:HlyD family secretion protein